MIKPMVLLVQFIYILVRCLAGPVRQLRSFLP